MLIALIFAGVDELRSYFSPDKIALAMYRAKPVRAKNFRGSTTLWKTIEKVGLPMPKIYVIRPSRECVPRLAVNRIMLGAVTQGILNLLTDENWKECWPRTGTRPQPRHS